MCLYAYNIYMYVYQYTKYKIAIPESPGYANPQTSQVTLPTFHQEPLRIPNWILLLFAQETMQDFDLEFEVDRHYLCEAGGEAEPSAQPCAASGYQKRRIQSSEFEMGGTNDVNRNFRTQMDMKDTCRAGNYTSYEVDISITRRAYLV